MHLHRNIRTLVLAVLPSVLVGLCPQPSQADWIQTNGPKGGSIRALLAVPNGSGGSTVYAGQPYVWRTDQNGASWTELKSGITDPNAFALLAVPDGSGGNDLLVGTGNGIFRSTTNGASWSAASNGIPTNLAIYALASGANGSGGTNLYAGAYLGNVYRSTDNGSSWAAVSSGLPVGQAQIGALTTTAAGTVLAGTGDGIYRSTNFGATWTRVLSSFYGFDFATNGTTLYAGTSNGVYRSTNDGATWTPINNGITFTWVYAVAAIPNGSGVTLFAGAGGVLRSTDNGATWTFANNGITAINIQALTTAGTDLYAGTSDGVFRSTDGGNSWSNVSLIYSAIQAIAVAPGGALLTGTENDIFRSSDAGASWSHTQLHIKALDFAVNPNGTSGASVFAGSALSGVFKSTDDGVTWTDSNNDLEDIEVNSVIAAPNGQGGTNVLLGDYSGIFLSTDDGASWRSVERSAMPVDWAVVPSGSGGTKIFGAGFGGVVVSSDYGATWSTSGFGQLSRAIAATDDGTNLFVGGDTFGIYRSTNGGATWSAVNNGLPDLAILTLLSPDGSSLLAGGSGGVFLSTDQGDHWTWVGNGLSTGVSSLALSADGTTVYAGTTEYGVWKRPLTEVMRATAVSEDAAPRAVSVRSYPNPFHPHATIQYTLPRTGRVRLSIFDVSGRLVRTMVDGIRGAGDQRVTWDGTDDRGSRVGSGVYLYRLQAGELSLTRKVELLK